MQARLGKHVSYARLVAGSRRASPRGETDLGVRRQVGWDFRIQLFAGQRVRWFLGARPDCPANLDQPGLAWTGIRDSTGGLRPFSSRVSGLVRPASFSAA